MTRTALPQTQVGIVTLLKATPAFLTLVRGLYDAVPETPTPLFPYAVIDDPFEVPDRTFGQDGHEQTFLLSIYTRDGSATPEGTGAAGFRTGLLIANEAITALMDSTLTVGGHDVTDVDVVSVECFRETDGITRRCDITFTFRLEDAL
jgi:hypothetical protein